MKTQLVQLESHDDVVSIRDKMSWAKTPRILLVWPHGKRVDVRPFDLVLLRRHAVSLGAELGLVTRESEMRTAARRIGMPVFSNANDAQRKPWPLRRFSHPARRAPRRDLRRVRAMLPSSGLFDDAQQIATLRLAVFATGVLAVLLVALFLLPSAEIHITAPTRPQSLDISVSAETDVSQVSLTGVIPSRPLTFDSELTDSILSTGEMVVPDQTAEGQVTFTNLGAAAVEVPAGTVVLTTSTPPVRFATLDVAQVPIGVGSSVDARARALAPGSAGNVNSGTVAAFEGPLGLSLGVNNEAPMTGGSDLTSASATDADRQTLRERVLKHLQEQARARIALQLQSGDVFFPSTFSFSKVLDESYTPGVGKPGGKLTLTMRAEFQAYYASAADMRSLVTRVLDASMPAGYEPLDDSLSIQAVSPLFGNADGNTRWKIRAQRSLRPRVDPARVIALVQGKTVWSAGSLLQETYGLDAPPEIHVQPFFWLWLPSLPFRIQVAG